MPVTRWHILLTWCCPEPHKTLSMMIVYCRIQNLNGYSLTEKCQDGKILLADFVLIGNIIWEGYRWKNI